MSGVAVVVGGTAGVGRACCNALVRQGYRIAIIARDEARLNQVVEELEGGGAQAMGWSCDAADAAEMLRIRDEIATSLGEPEVWVNCAMLTVFSPFNDLSSEEFSQVINATLLGQVNGTRAALTGMRKTGKGSIVNVGSGLAYRSVPLQSAYCAAKHAINGFTASIRSELIHDGLDDITLSLVQLPAINTPQFDWARHRFSHQPRPAAPVYQPEVAAQAVMQAIEERSRELLVGRSVIQLVLGNMIVPALLDKKLASAAYDGQKSDRPVGQEDQSGNLMQAVSGNVGARGSYGEEARDNAWIVDADKLRYAAFGGAAIILLLIGILIG